MRNKILINLLILTGLSAYTAQAQEGWTLRRCIDYAIEHNINVQQTANSAEQSKVEVNTAKWARLPNLSGSASQNWSWVAVASAWVRIFRYSPVWNYRTSMHLPN